MCQPFRCLPPPVRRLGAAHHAHPNNLETRVAGGLVQAQFHKQRSTEHVLAQLVLALADVKQDLLRRLGHLEQGPHDIHAASVASQRRHGPGAPHQLVGQDAALGGGALQQGVCQHHRGEPVLREALHVATQGRHHSGTLPREAIGHDRHGHLVPRLVAAQCRRADLQEPIGQLDDAALAGSVFEQAANHRTAARVQGHAACQQLFRDARGRALSGDADGRLQHMTGVRRAGRGRHGATQPRQHGRHLRGACALQRQLHSVATHGVAAEPRGGLANHRRRRVSPSAAGGEVLHSLEGQNLRRVRGAPRLRAGRCALRFARRSALRRTSGGFLQRLQSQQRPGA
mmetsp:Transcript_19236/g.57549  ORF Transcript_19236/g.57549 Transcript_19236/m.57549 type:complete len:343 (+) Transcript_19236:278-1306(+)